MSKNSIILNNGNPYDPEAYLSPLLDPYGVKKPRTI